MYNFAQKLDLSTLSQLDKTQLIPNFLLWCKISTVKSDQHEFHLGRCLTFFLKQIYPQVLKKNENPDKESIK